MGKYQPRPHGHMSLLKKTRRLVFFRRDIWPWGRGWGSMVPTVTKFAQNVSKRPMLKLLKLLFPKLSQRWSMSTVKSFLRNFKVVHPENLVFLKKKFLIHNFSGDREKYVQLNFSNPNFSNSKTSLILANSPVPSKPLLH